MMMDFVKIRDTKMACGFVKSKADLALYSGFGNVELTGARSFKPRLTLSRLNIKLALGLWLFAGFTSLPKIAFADEARATDAGSRVILTQARAVQPSVGTPTPPLVINWGLTRRDFSILKEDELLEKSRAGAKISALRRAATAGDTSAQVLLGLALIRARGISKDEVSGTNWLRIAAESNNPRGMYEYGVSLFEGRGLERNPAGAGDWFRTAADANNILAIREAAAASKLRSDAVVDQDRAISLYRKGVALNDPDSMVSLAVFYDQGERLTKNPTEAIRLRRMAADLGNTWAMMQTGLHLGRPAASKVQKVEALRYFERAAQLGTAGAAYELGRRHDLGIGVVPNIERARIWYGREQASVAPPISVYQSYISMVDEVATPTAISAGLAGLEWIARLPAEETDLLLRDTKADAALKLAEYSNRGVGGPRDANAALKWARFAFSTVTDAVYGPEVRAQAQTLIDKLATEGIR